MLNTSSPRSNCRCCAGATTRRLGPADRVCNTIRWRGLVYRSRTMSTCAANATCCPFRPTWLHRSSGAPSCGCLSPRLCEGAGMSWAASSRWSRPARLVVACFCSALIAAHINCCRFHRCLGGWCAIIPGRRIVEPSRMPFALTTAVSGSPSPRCRRMLDRHT